MNTRADEPLAGLFPGLAALAEADPRREVCGLVVEGAGGAPETWPFLNVAADPSRAFALHPRALLEALARLDAVGRRLLAVYHSHPDGGAALSARDLAEAVAEGAPLVPGVAQIVVALEAGRVVEIRSHRWAGTSFQAGPPWRPDQGTAGPPP